MFTTLWSIDLYGYLNHDLSASYPTEKLLAMPLRL
ncbi:hypothetical protein V202x_30870 [Gimesia aquarii]|uniref:Uncharacterized protein n=1 Tax=Gimesia aquarii TaxID=2527964 RepID=A0A517WWP7_9PLAN|nr:hypothetical protein V202x_30870 [Gimesia aquarii]